MRILTFIIESQGATMEFRGNDSHIMSQLALFMNYYKLGYEVESCFLRLTLLTISILLLLLSLFIAYLHNLLSYESVESMTLFSIKQLLFLDVKFG